VRMTLRVGASAYSLTVHLPTGNQVYDLSHMNDNQLEGVRELVVDSWSHENGFPVRRN
jgi:hypothetical protein